MLTTSELNERTKNRKKNWDAAKKEKRKKRAPVSKSVRVASDLKYARKLKEPRIAKLAELAKSLGKVSASGKRMCLWSNCTTIISVYNYDECCSRHQREWNAKNMVFPLD